VDLTAVESSVAAVLTSAAATTALLGGDLKYRLSGYSIAIISAVAVLAAIASCSRWILKRKRKSCTNLSDGLPTWPRPLPKLSTTRGSGPAAALGCSLRHRMEMLVLFVLLSLGTATATESAALKRTHYEASKAGCILPARDGDVLITMRPSPQAHHGRRTEELALRLMREMSNTSVPSDLEEERESVKPFHIIPALAAHMHNHTLDLLFEIRGHRRV